MRVAICIITYQRLAGLKRLLEGLNQLTFERCEPSSLEVVVVNNHPDTPVKALCDHLPFRWTLKCCVEPRRGISFARNKAIECVSPESDFVAFIDDDEVPDPRWLDELLFVQKTCAADVVSGPVRPHFEQPVPNWILQGRFFERTQYPTGTILNAAATNNVLIRRSVLQPLDVVFDERWALSGGEDWHLFRRLHAAGSKIVWANEALVCEWIPKSRTNLRWLIQRSYRRGNTESLCEIALNSTFATRCYCVFKGVRRMILGTLLMPLACLKGPAAAVKNLRYLSHSVGMLAGVLDWQYQEYQVIHPV